MGYVSFRECTFQGSDVYLHHHKSWSLDPVETSEVLYLRPCVGIHMFEVAIQLPELPWILRYTRDPETNRTSPLKMDGWNTIVYFWDCLFSGAFAVIPVTGYTTGKFVPALAHGERAMHPSGYNS